MASIPARVVLLTCLTWFGCPAPDANLERGSLGTSDAGRDGEGSSGGAGGTTASGAGGSSTGGGSASGAGGSNGFGGSPSTPASDMDRRDLLARSRSAWAALQIRNGADYSYVVRKTIYPFGGTITTTIEVRGNRVVRRSFEGGASWTETGATIGSHDRISRAAPAITLDELYLRCEVDVLTADERRYTLTLSTHDDGVIALCQRWPRGCQDDCAEGHEVTSYQFLD